MGAVLEGRNARAALLGGAAALTLVALAAALSQGASATLTPPPTGDWTIDANEDASLLSGTTVVTGNITVAGTLTVANATLELAAPGNLTVPYLLVLGPGSLSLDNATLRAGPNPTSRMTVRASAGATLALRSTVIEGLGNATVGDLSLVGAHLEGATVSAYDTTITGSSGGLGLGASSTLTARNLSMSVDGRALYLTGASSATLDAFFAVGNRAASEFLVLVNGSTLTLRNSRIENGTNLLLLLSSTCTATNATFLDAEHAAVLSIGSAFTIDGGLVAPRGNGTLGVEAYGGSVTARARFQNYSFGIAALGATVRVANSSFASSNGTPLGGFAGVYAFDGVVSIDNSTFNGTYALPTGSTDCTNSAVWVVRSQVTVTNVDMVCFSTQFYSEDSDAVVRSLSVDNGSTGALFFAGTADVVGLRAANFTNQPPSQAVAIQLYGVVGRFEDIGAVGSQVGAEIRQSDALLVNFSGGSPGLGARILSGSPVFTDSTFTIKNETAVEVQGGSPRIVNSSFWLSADTYETYGIVVAGGSPTVEGNDFHGTYLLTYGIHALAGDALITNNTFEHFDRAVRVFSKTFLVSANTFTECWNGVDARDGSQGRITGNRFANLTGSGAGNAVNVYYSAATVSDNTFVDVNYGVKVFNTNRTLGAPPRVSGNRFENVSFYAIELINTTMYVIVDNNTVRNATRGGIEALFSNLTSAYNVVYDSLGYGYEATYSNLTIVGGRIENVREGIHATNTPVAISYTTFLLNHAGMTITEAEVWISNCSFQFNGIAAQFVTNRTIFVNDSIFVGNVESLLAYNKSHIAVRDTNFIGTLDWVVKTDQDATGSIDFTRRGEINGGRFLLRGVFTSTADTLTLRSLRMTFATPIGSLPGASIRGAASLTMTSVSLANNSVPFFFEIEDSTGNLTKVQVRAAFPSLARPSAGPYFARSNLSLRDVAINQSLENFTVADTTLTAYNLSVKENRGSGVVLLRSSLVGVIITVLDNRGCGIEGWGGALLNATNLTVRGNAAGGLCFNASSAEVLDGDFSNLPRDLALDGGSVVYAVSTALPRGYYVNDTSLLTIAWRLDLRVTYPNAALLPLVHVVVSDATGHTLVLRPNTAGRVDALSALPERIVTAGGADVRTPYLILARYETASATANVSLTADRLVQLDLADRVPPQVAILDPADGGLFAVSTVTLRFTANDSGSGLSELLYRFGAGAFTAVDPGAGPFEITRDLVDGEHMFVVRAVDFGGNVLESAVNFTVDTRAPLITVVSPRPPANVTRAANVTVQVTLEPDVVAVWIGGVQVNISAGGASRSVPLPEGDSTVLVEAEDRVGNRGNISLRLFADRTPPSLTIEPAGNITAETFVVIRGHTEPGSQVLVGNTAVPLENGSFELLLTLEEGRNSFEIRSRDALQNENWTQVTVTRGTRQPSHALDLAANLAGLALILAGAAVAVIWFRRASRPDLQPPGGAPP